MPELFYPFSRNNFRSYSSSAFSKEPWSAPELTSSDEDSVGLIQEEKTRPPCPLVIYSQFKLFPVVVCTSKITFAF